MSYYAAGILKMSMNGWLPPLAGHKTPLFYLTGYIWVPEFRAVAVAAHNRYLSDISGVGFKHQSRAQFFAL